MTIETNTGTTAATPPPPSFEASQVFRDLVDGDPEKLRTAAHVKRFLELYSGDPDFRQAIESGRKEVSHEQGLIIDPDGLLPLLDPAQYPIRTRDELGRWPLVRLWSDRQKSLYRCTALLRDEGDPGVVNPRFHRWRQRQICRNDSELGKANRAITYPVAALELSRGCTVGCWFCSVSAEPFQGAFPYTRESSRLWLGVLETLCELTGPAAGRAFCYWATDPMDNPDYAHFIEDFHRITGAMPQTTTAAPLKDVALTRRVLELQRRHRSTFNRFSITTLHTLRAVHREFTPEEMLGVELVMQHKQAGSRKALSGRALSSYLKLKAQGKEDRLPDLNGVYGTTSCIAGFLINMVERSIRLISPCRASPEYPKGNIVHDRGWFSSVQEFSDVCRAMIANRMPDHLAPEDTLAFRGDLKYIPWGDGFRLENETGIHTLAGQPYLRQLGELVASGRYRMASVQEALLDQGADFFAVNKSLGDLYDSGLLRERIFDQDPINRQAPGSGSTKAPKSSGPRSTGARSPRDRTRLDVIHT